MQEINTLEQAVSFLEASLRGAEVTSFSIGEGLSTLTIEIEGPGYNGVITGEIARGLAIFQEELYRAARFALTGVDGRESRLTNPDKQSLELSIEIKKGCTLINIDLGKWADGLADVLKHMPPKYTALIIVGSVAVLGIGWVGHHYITEHFEAQRVQSVTDASQAQLQAALDANVAIVDRMAAVIQSEPKIARFAEATSTGIIEVATRANGATSVGVGQILEMNADELAKLKKRKPRTSAESVTEKGLFRVIHVDGSSSPFKFTLNGAPLPGEFTVEFDPSEFTAEQVRGVWDAISNQKDIELVVKGVVLNDRVRGGVLVDIAPFEEDQP